MHKQDKKRKLGVHPDHHFFVDLHYHLGTRTGKSIDQLIGVLEHQADIVGITGRGKGWASTEPGGCEYTYAQFIKDAETSKEWRMNSSSSATTLTKDDKRIIIIDTQETVTCDDIELLTFGPRKFTKHDSSSHVLANTDFTILTHPFAHPCKYHFNEDNLAAHTAQIAQVSAVETYDQSVRLLYGGRANQLAESFATKFGKPGVTSSDAHNYYGIAYESSGMVIAPALLDCANIVDSLKSVIMQHGPRILHYKTQSPIEYVGYLKIIGKDWNTVMWGRKSLSTR
jgi:hypothetical protein